MHIISTQLHAIYNLLLQRRVSEKLLPEKLTHFTVGL
jgi:hypothetical protein